MSEFKVGCSPLTDTIYAGRVTLAGLWSGKKHDVTDSAVDAVAQYLLQIDSSVSFDYRGKRYKMSVMEIHTETLAGGKEQG